MKIESTLAASTWDVLHPVNSASHRTAGTDVNKNWFSALTTVEAAMYDWYRNRTSTVMEQTCMKADQSQRAIHALKPQKVEAVTLVWKVRTIEHVPCSLRCIHLVKTECMLHAVGCAHNFEAGAWVGWLVGQARDRERRRVPRVGACNTQRTHAHTTKTRDPANPCYVTGSTIIDPRSSTVSIINHLDHLAGFISYFFCWQKK